MLDALPLEALPVLLLLPVPVGEADPELVGIFVAVHALVFRRFILPLPTHALPAWN